MILTALLFAVFGMSNGGRIYHPITIPELAAQNPGDWSAKMATHVEVEGYVVYTALEEDGDRHIALCAEDGVTFERERCVVAECIPKLPCKVRKGQHVRVRGITRYDAESPGHHWWEIHPVEFIQ